MIKYDIPKSDFSYGIDYKISRNFSIGIFSEKDNFFSLKFVYKNSPMKDNPRYRYDDQKRTSAINM